MHVESLSSFNYFESQNMVPRSPRRVAFSFYHMGKRNKLKKNGSDDYSYYQRRSKDSHVRFLLSPSSEERKTTHFVISLFVILVD